MERDLEDVAEAVQRARDNGRRCSLLIGAGCSVTANIPLASGIVEDFKAGASRVYARARIACGGAEPSYADCMAQLTVGERSDLLARYIENGQVNPAHLAIAALIKQGYVDRVFTTNFDSLVVRACAQLQVFPVAYDLAASPAALPPADIPDSAVFYLYGRHADLELPADDPRSETQARRLIPLFGAACEARMLLVVGYSGENDPLFRHVLANVERFYHGLYWVAYKDNDPAPLVRDSLFRTPKDAFLVRGHDADSFLGGLAQQLRCLSSDLSPTPSVWTDESFAPLKSIAPPAADRNNGASQSRGKIESAPPALPPSAPPCAAPSGEARLQTANALLEQGEYDRLIHLWYDTDTEARQELAEMVSLAYVGQGNLLYHQGQQEPRKRSSPLLAQAIKKYQSALTIRPDMHQALYNWGCALLLLARPATGTERYRLISEAEEKFLQIEAQRPGTGLYNLARLSAIRGDEEAIRKWLILWREFGAQPDPEEIAHETDFDSVRDRDWFRALRIGKTPPAALLRIEERVRQVLA